MRLLPLTRIPDDLAADFTRLREGRRSAVVHRAFLPAFRRLSLLHAAERRPADLHPDVRPFPAEGGRGELGVAPAGARGDPPVDETDARHEPERAAPGEVVIRPYRRGGMVRHLTEDRYLLGDRPLHELAVTERLRRREVPVPTPLAAVRSEAGPGYRGALVTRRVPGARAAPVLLAGASEAGARRLLAPMGDAVRRLHEAGGLHPDLNAHNFLLGTSPGGEARRAAPDAEVAGRVTLVDFDRARLLDRPLPRPLRAWTLRRLRRSLRKLELAAALGAWEAFLEAYRGR